MHPCNSDLAALPRLIQLSSTGVSIRWVIPLHSPLLDWSVLEGEAWLVGWNKNAPSRLKGTTAQGRPQHKINSSYFLLLSYLMRLRLPFSRNCECCHSCGKMKGTCGGRISSTFLFRVPCTTWKSSLKGQWVCLRSLEWGMEMLRKWENCSQLQPCTSRALSLGKVSPVYFEKLLPLKAPVTCIMFSRKQSQPWNLDLDARLSIFKYQWQL